MLKLVFFILLVLLAITILLFILTKSKEHMIQTFSIPTFLGTSTDENLQTKQSIIEQMNKYFNDSTDGDDNIDEGSDDLGE